MKLAVVGSRDFPYAWMIDTYLTQIDVDIDEIVSGGAKGPDSWSQQWADDCYVPFILFSADWENLGKSAGFKRNAQIVEYCDELIAFWDGKSRGTKHSIDLARKARKLREVIIVDRS